MLWFGLILGLISISFAIWWIGEHRFNVDWDYSLGGMIAVILPAAIAGFTTMYVVIALVFTTLQHQEEFIDVEYAKQAIELEYQSTGRYSTSSQLSYNKTIAKERAKLANPWQNIFANKRIAELKIYDVGGNK